jgi:hypothetical protein
MNKPENPRRIIWFSQGAASAVAARLTLKKYPAAILARCETNNEHPDNYRFEKDVSEWVGKPVTLLKSSEYESVKDVWNKTRWMAGVSGARCTVEMKVAPRLDFQRPKDIHVFGYTADSEDVARANRLCENYPELTVETPLIDAGITKAGCIGFLERAKIKPPLTYELGFPNANCMGTGCVKATSPDYWSLYRKHFPNEFAETAKQARELGVRLCRVKGERTFIDEIPEDWPTTKPIVPVCDFLCVLAEAAE